MTIESIDPLAWLRKAIEEGCPDMMRSMVHEFAQVPMDAEVDELCGAPRGARDPQRVNSRNGYRTRQFGTRVGSMELAIPKLRTGSYYPDWLLEPRRRAEKALVQVVCEAYIQGVSTRRVEHLVQSMGLDRMSKSQVSRLTQELDEVVGQFRNRPLDGNTYPYVWIDALIHKSREDGRVANVATLVATAVSNEGHREILGIDVITNEDAAGWLEFIRGLVQRGLSGVLLVISDAHKGLKTAIATALPGAAWQRCRTHFMANLLTRVPRTAQGFVATLVRSIFSEPTPEDVPKRHGLVVDQIGQRLPDAARYLSEAREEILAFCAFPPEHWKKIWSNNPLERLNKEIRRRTDVVGIFPNRAAVIRLVGAMLAEQHDEWQVARRYMSLGSLSRLTPPKALEPCQLAPDRNGQELPADTMGRPAAQDPTRLPSHASNPI